MAKRGGDPLFSILGMHVVSAVLMAGPALVLPFPAAESWPYLALCPFLHAVYILALARALEAGDLGVVYPIARGSAPVLVAVGSAWLAHERLGLVESLGVGLVGVGIVSLSRAGGERATAGPRAVSWAVLTGLSIAVYTINDGLGARSAGSAIAFGAWLHVISGVMAGAWLTLARRGELRASFRERGRDVMIGGAIATFAYVAVLWALTRLPMARVSSLRETSVLFAAVIAWLVLGEGFGRRRVASAALILVGLLLLHSGSVG